MTANSWKPSARIRKPAELLKPVIDPAGCYPDAFKGSENWIYTLSAAEIAEVEDAVETVEAKGLRLLDIGREQFPLPRLATGLKDVQTELMEGRGFALIRGLPIDNRSRSWIANAFWGIGTHIGRPVSQNGKGHVLGHVKDLGEDYSKVRGYMTRALMDFHTDRADVLSLCCLHPAKKGGHHRICSSVTVYNEMLKRRPDLAQELDFSFYKSRSGEIPVGETNPWTRTPAVSVEKGYFTARGVNAGVRKAQNIPGVPKLTDAQLEALKLYKELARELYIDIEFRIGDISYVQNFVTMHSRTEFEDWPEPERKRHLLRLWLNNGLRPLTKEVRDEIGGVVVPGTVLQTPLEVA